MNYSANFNAFSMVKIRLNYLAQCRRIIPPLGVGSGIVGYEECEEGWRKIRHLFIFLEAKYMESLNIPPLKK